MDSTRDRGGWRVAFGSPKKGGHSLPRSCVESLRKWSWSRSIRGDGNATQTEVVRDHGTRFRWRQDARGVAHTTLWKRCSSEKVLGWAFYQKRAASLLQGAALGYLQSQGIGHRQGTGGNQSHRQATGMDQSNSCEAHSGEEWWEKIRFQSQMEVRQLQRCVADSQSDWLGYG